MDGAPPKREGNEQEKQGIKQAIWCRRAVSCHLCCVLIPFRQLVTSFILLRVSGRPSHLLIVLGGAPFWRRRVSCCYRSVVLSAAVAATSHSYHPSIIEFICSCPRAPRLFLHCASRVGGACALLYTLKPPLSARPHTATHHHTHLFGFVVPFHFALLVLLCLCQLNRIQHCYVNAAARVLPPPPRVRAFA